MEEKKNERYQLRRAAGCCWLLDMEQDGKDYRKPIVLNECGAQIWELLREGRTVDGIAEYLESEYGIEADQAAQDVLLFMETLKKTGIMW